LYRKPAFDGIKIFKFAQAPGVKEPGTWLMTNAKF